MNPEPDAVVEAETPAGGRRARAVVVAVAIVLVAGAALAARTQGTAADVPLGSDPGIILEESLTSGTPAYVLVHSLT